MRILAAALLEEACRRTGPRLEQARNASFKAQSECQDALRKATANGRKMLLEVEEFSAEAASKVPRATPMELLQALAEVESAAQYLLSREVEGEEGDEEEDDDEVVEADALGSFATPLLAPRRISNASVGSTLTTTSWCVERRSSWVRQLFSGKAADDEAFSSASAPVLRQVHFDGEQRELILEGEPQELLNDMIGGWCGAHSALLDGEAAALEQLARDTETIAKAVAIVNEMTEQAGETLSLVEAHASNAEVNTREGVKHLLTATKDAEKTQGVKTAITASTVFLVTGLLAGAPILPAVAMGVVVAPIGWGTSRMVQRQSRKRLQRSIAQRESQLRQ